MNEKIDGHILDNQQIKIAMDDSDYLLVIAGAGSGKTLTILGKINYLINYKNVLPSEILCISFTKASADNLKNKIIANFNLNIEVYTFHKLGLNILKNGKYNISIKDNLEILVKEFFLNTILLYPWHMQLVLKYFGYKVKKDIKEYYQKFYNKNNHKILSLSKTLITFIKLFKCNDHKLADFVLFLKKCKFTFSLKKYTHNKIFLILALNIYLIYENNLSFNNELDFDDMIIKSTEYVKNNDFNLKFKYIIIDEYQDTSLIRFNLVKELIKKLNANLMVVGDDFQSIYKFTGCDLSLFLDFKKYFKNANILKIENTYRNCQELIYVAGNFVMKNKRQLKKQLVSNKHILKPIKIVYYNNPKYKFEKLIKYIYKMYKTNILVLGRNNFDIYKYLNKNFELIDNSCIKYLYDDIKINYLTVHKSKGLEEENVVLINLCDDILGFPNKINDHDIINLVSIKKEKFKYAEERRLFYVALTRTKNNVFILVNKNSKSIFIKEIEKDYKNYIEIINL